MGKRREEKVTSPEVKQVAEVSAWNTGNHHLLDAARKAASALESVSNEYGVKLVGMVYVLSFENEDVHRSAHSHVRYNDTETEPQYNVSVDYNASA